MKYFFDTEFITGFKKPIPFLPTIGNWNKKDFFIHLVSIGIVAEDGREYYAVSNEFNPRLADEWVVDNVLIPIYTDFVHGDMRNHAPFNPKKNSGVTYGRGKSNQRIAQDIIDFCGFEGKSGTLSEGQFVRRNLLNGGIISTTKPEFYAYYADYDWVVFCSLFGRMIDLPEGFPMYCRDLKQILDEKQVQRENLYKQIHDPEFGLPDHIQSPLINPLKLKDHPEFPKHVFEHNALYDAKWNQRLFKFLTRNEPTETIKKTGDNH